MVILDDIRRDFSESRARFGWKVYLYDALALVVALIAIIGSLE